MLYICILCNKFDLNQALRVSHNIYVFCKIYSCKTGDGNFQWYSRVEALSAQNIASFTGKELLILGVSCYELINLACMDYHFSYRVRVSLVLGTVFTTPWKAKL